MFYSNGLALWHGLQISGILKLIMAIQVGQSLKTPKGTFTALRDVCAQYEGNPPMGFPRYAPETNRCQISGILMLIMTGGRPFK